MKLRIPALLCGLVGIAGCAELNTVPPYERPVITVTRYDLASLSLNGGAHGLSRASAHELREAVRTYGAGHPQTLHVTLLGGTPAQRREARAAAIDAGVPAGNVADGGRPAKGGHTLLAALESYVAIPPDCRQRVLVGGGPHANFIDSGFGCATLVDLALSVSDPKDLIGRQGVVLRDGARAARPVDAYRRFANDDGVEPISRATTLVATEPAADPQ